MFIIQYDGDLPRTRGLTAPEAVGTLPEALDRLKELFGANPPDVEDDRVLVFEANPSATPSMKVVWAFIGWHWSYDGLPGLTEAKDELPGIGSLRALIDC